MVQHIDISVLLAEIEREYKSLSNATNDFAMGRKAELKNILSFIESIKAEDVYLEKELIIWHRLHFKKEGTFEKYGGFYLANSSQLDLAKHFFELGRKADELPQKPEQG